MKNPRNLGPLFPIANALFVLLNPGCWGRVGGVSAEWDKALNKAMDREAVITELGDYTVKLNGVTVWISNYPYGYGNYYNYGRSSPMEEELPYALTRRRLKKYIAKYQEQLRKEREERERARTEEIIREIKGE